MVKKYLPQYKDFPTQRQRLVEIPVSERVNNFNEVQLVLEEDNAVEEARRCLSCRACLGCGLCSAECKKKAIDLKQTDEIVELDVDLIIITPPVARLAAPVEDEFGYNKYANVVTGNEFEYILSEAGPYGGLVLRPSDGEIPQRLAFISSAATKGQAESNYYSVMYAVKEAQLAMQKIENLHVCVFYCDVDGYEETIEQYRKQIPGIVFNRGRVRAVTESGQNQNLIIEWDGEDNEFEMMVLSTALVFPPHIRQWGRRLGLNMENHTYWETTDTALVETTQPEIFFAGARIL